MALKQHLLWLSLFTGILVAKGVWHSCKEKKTCTPPQAWAQCQSIDRRAWFAVESPAGIEMYKHALRKAGQTKGTFLVSSKFCYHGPVTSVGPGGKTNTLFVRVDRDNVSFSNWRQHRQGRFPCFSRQEEVEQVRFYERVNRTCEALAGKHATDSEKAECAKQLEAWDGLKWLQSLYRRFKSWKKTEWIEACWGLSKNGTSGPYAIAAENLLRCLFYNKCDKMIKDNYPKVPLDEKG